MSNAAHIIESALQGHDLANVYAMVSFGKDSLVLIDILSRYGVKNVLYLEDDDEVVDREHIMATCNHYALNVYRMNRGRGMFFVAQDQPLWLAFPFVSDRHFTPIPTNMISYEDGHTGEFHCVDEMLYADRGSPLSIQPTLIFSGFKRSDVTAKGCLTYANVLSPEALVAHMERMSALTEIAPGLPLALPLLDWSDKDVWSYLKTWEIPWSTKVYDDDGHRRPTDIQWCFRCHDPRQPSLVACPKVNRPVLNLPSMTQDSDLQLTKLVRLGVMTEPEQKDLRHG